MDVATVKLDPRTVTGKKVKQLRRQGVIPVHLYGADIQPSNLQIDGRTLNRLLPQVGTNIPVSIEVEDQDMENICFVREVQRHPVTEEVIHVDFLRVDVTRTVSAEVPLTLTGTSLPFPRWPARCFRISSRCPSRRCQWTCPPRSLWTSRS